MASLIYRLLWLSCGIASPVYCSYKTIKDKNVKEYVRMMMYWVAFAIFSFAEVFTDFFLSWLPFYFEFKVVVLLWLVLPATKGSTVVYTRFIHPMLLSREKEIDMQVRRVKDHCFDSLVFLGSKGLAMFTDLLMTATIKGQAKLASHLRSLSLSDLSSEGMHTLQRSESLQAHSSIRSTTKRSCIQRFHTISSPMSRLEMKSIVGSDDHFRGKVSSSKLSILEENIASVSEHKSSIEVFPMELHKEAIDNLVGLESTLDDERHSSLVDKTLSVSHQVTFTSLQESQNEFHSVETPRKDEEKKSSAKELKELHSSNDTESVHAPSNESSEDRPHVKVVPSNDFPSEVLKRSSPSSSTRFPDRLTSSSAKSTPRPPTKSSGFTKTNFLRSFNFFDTKGSKSIKNSRPE